MNYYPVEEDINSTIETADPSSFIYLPEGTITTPIVISNDSSIIIIGQQTVLDTRGTNTQNAVTITVDADVSGFEVINDSDVGYSGVFVDSCAPSLSNIESTSDLAFNVESCDSLEGENLKASNSNTGFEIVNSLNCSFVSCEADRCNLGLNLEGSSSIIGDSYGHQEFGINIVNSDVSLLEDYTTYYFEINTIEYKFDTTTNTTYNNIVQLMNNSTRVIAGDNFSVDFNASIVNGDIRTTALITGESVSFDRGSTGDDLFYLLIDTQEEITIDCIDAGNFLGSNLSGKYFTFSSDTTDYYVWYQLGGAGADPAGVGEPLEGLGKTGAEIDLDANDDAPTVASKTEAVISLLLGITVSVINSTLTIIVNQRGNVTNAIDVDTGFTISVEQGSIGTFDSAVSGENQATRTDRSHHNTFTGLSTHDGVIGIRMINSDNNIFEKTNSYNNSNIGIWHMPTSYSNKINGEIYNNVNYGIRNTDKTGGLHILDATSTWWGDITGPSGGGPGSGDKVSNYVTYEPWSRSGTEPLLSYPITRDWIWSMLGNPIVRVELTENQVSDSIDMAIDRYMYYRTPEKVYEYVDIGSKTTEFILPVHITKESVIDITYSPHSQLFQQLTGAGEAFFLTYYLQQTGGTFASDFYIAMSYKETLERTLGIHPTYEFLSHDDGTGNMRDFVKIYPRPNISLSIGILYARPLTEEEVDSTTWIRKYALTWSKEQLGRIRSKFASIPGPTGESQLDGQQLISEATTERELLEQSIILRGEPLGFSIG